VLLPWAERIAPAGERIARALTPDVIAGVLEGVPDAWLADEPRFDSPAAHRAAYAGWFGRRVAAAALFSEEAERARHAIV
jgi:hypothetical protein